MFVGSQSLGISLPPDVVSRSNVVKLLFRHGASPDKQLGTKYDKVWYN